MATWPLTLPQSPGGVKEQAPYDRITATPDVGPPKRRPRYTAGIRALECSFLMKSDEVAVLDAFYQQTLVGGTDFFDWVHPRTGAAMVGRFTSPPEYQAQGPMSYRVTCKLEVLP